VSEVIETAFENEEITVQTGTPVTALTETNDGIRVDAAGADGTVSVTASDVALAAGRTPNTDGLQLEDIGASLDENGFVETDDSFRTTADGVYAIGDVSGPPMFTHSARDDADLLYRHLAKSEEISTKGRTVPWAVFTDPQIGHVGLTEQEAREAGTRSASAARTSLTKASRRRSAKTGDLSNWSRTRRLTNYSERTSSANRAPDRPRTRPRHRTRATADDIANTMHIHPTLPESINSAAGGVHKPS